MSVLVLGECRSCGVNNRTSPGFSVLSHPAVAGFLQEHGVNHDAPPWRFDWCLRDDTVSVVGEDPPRARVEIAVEDDTLTVTLDEAGDVVGTARASAE